ncbi:hypothetical protein LTR05_002162 [Lithohypha guttulata]|uniref:C3H1-type domain-containing protein n=1 Tax=Lithohypha guttulata TaxID=1690604 RepID=A0AAN7YHT0_9EURO|nr:hypothetical protein LTR05_002162 [Lithohypha guttulata]
MVNEVAMAEGMDSTILAANTRTSLKHIAPSKFDAGQKRSHATAFQNPPNQTLRNSRPLAPPAVPSFGVDFSALLPKKPETESVQTPVQPRKTNLLGLTPTARNEGSEAEDDEDEEAKLAAPAFTLNALQFEHRGQTSTLKTPEEIAAWVAERRKRWPTEAKREVAQKEAEERVKKHEQDKAARLEASKAAAKTRQEEWQKKKLEKEKSQLRQKMLKEQIHKAKAYATESTPLNAAQIKAERLRRKAEKIAQQLKVAEAQLEKQGPTKDAADDADLEALLTQVDRAAAVRSHGDDADVDAIESASEDSDVSSRQGDTLMADDTSTSGTSDLDSGESDSDAPPEELTSKRADAPPPARRASLDASTDTRPLCTNLAKAGRCKFGRKCRFRHPKPDKKAVAAQQSGAGNRRKGIYQVMVEKEQEEEQKRVLRAIIALGDAGLLKDDEASKE